MSKQSDSIGAGFIPTRNITVGEIHELIKFFSKTDNGHGKRTTGIVGIVLAQPEKQIFSKISPKI